MKTIVNDSGLFIPREALADWGELTVEETPYRITIRPKNLVYLTYGCSQADPRLVDELIDDVEAGGMVVGDGDVPGSLLTG